MLDGPISPETGASNIPKQAFKIVSSFGMLSCIGGQVWLSDSGSSLDISRVFGDGPT